MKNYNDIVRGIDEYLKMVEEEGYSICFDYIADGVSDENIESDNLKSDSAIAIFKKNDCLELAYMGWDELFDEREKLVVLRDKQNLAEQLKEELTPKVKDKTNKRLKV